MMGSYLACVITASMDSSLSTPSSCLLHQCSQNGRQQQPFCDSGTSQWSLRPQKQVAVTQSLSCNDVLPSLPGSEIVASHQTVVRRSGWMGELFVVCGFHALQFCLLNYTSCCCLAAYVHGLFDGTVGSP